MRVAALALGLIVSLAGSASSDPIEGNWRTQAGPIAGIAPCGGGYCITLKNGRFAGKRIGKFSPDGAGSYSGTITDPNNDKTYSGSAALAGASLKLSGCVLGILCRTQTWTRQ